MISDFIDVKAKPSKKKNPAETLQLADFNATTNVTEDCYQGANILGPVSVEQQTKLESQIFKCGHCYSQQMKRDDTGLF